jgi:hemoglobin
MLGLTTGTTDRAANRDEDSMAMGHDAHATDAATDYERVGGGPAVAEVVRRFYELVLADPQLQHYFVDVDMTRLKRHQVLLVSQVLGGPAEYDGRDLAEAHAGLNIGNDDFGRVVQHLTAALEESGVDSDIIGRVGAALAGTAPDIVTDPTT